MRKIILLTLFIFALSGIVFGQRKDGSDGLSVYRDEKFPFSVFYPKDWAQTEPSHPQTRFKATSELGLGLADFSVVVTSPKEISNLSPSDFANGLVKRPEIVNAMIKMGLPDAKLIASGKTYLSNKEAFFIKSSGTFRNFDESFDLILYQILLVFEGNSYALTFRALKDEFDDYFPIFKVIASSFVVRPKVTEQTIKKVPVKQNRPVKRKN
jgi:hypothetical protein